MGEKESGKPTKRAKEKLNGKNKPGNPINRSVVWEMSSRFSVFEGGRFRR